jgi:hypothetical protein
MPSAELLDYGTVLWLIITKLGNIRVFFDDVYEKLPFTLSSNNATFSDRLNLTMLY